MARRTGPGVALLLTAALAACVPSANVPAPSAAPPPPPAASGTAEANCTAELRRRYGSAVRIQKVTIHEAQRGVVRASRPGGYTYQCFTNSQGRVANIIVDRPFPF